MGGCVSCGNVGQDEPHLREQSTHPKHQPAKAPGESYKLIGPPVKTTNGSDSAPSHSSKSAPPYEILHGTIQLARDDCNEVLAASWVPRAPDGSMSKSLHRQIVNQRHLGKHPNVLEFREMFTTQDFLVLVEEHVDGVPLEVFLEKCGALSEHEAHCAFIQGIAHRAVTLENVLVDIGSNDFTIKVTNFGTSKKEGDPYPATIDSNSSFTCPETLVSQMRCNQHELHRAQDIWSLGVVLYQLVTGRPPFRNPRDPGLLMPAALMRGDWRQPAELTWQLSVPCQHLLSRLFEPSPTERITAEQLMRHEWVKSGPPVDATASPPPLTRRHTAAAGDFHSVVRRHKHRHSHRENLPMRTSLPLAAPAAAPKVEQNAHSPVDSVPDAANIEVPTPFASSPESTAAVAKSGPQSQAKVYASSVHAKPLSGSSSSSFSEKVPAAVDIRTMIEHRRQKMMLSNDILRSFN